MVVFLDPQATTRYVVDDEQELPEADRTVFVIRTLTQRQKLRLSPHFEALAEWADSVTTAVKAAKEGGDENAKLRATMTAELVDHIAEILEAGIAGVEGPNAPPRFTTPDQIPLDYWVELCTAISRAGTLTDDQAKN